MILENILHISEAVRQRFVGRAKALEMFYLRFACRHMKNGIYYYGEGGLGKTWILQKILLDGADDPVRTITEIIDFFDTQNHTVRGLQRTIQSRLQAPQAFQPYDEAIESLKATRKRGKEIHPSVIASLEARANRLFIECCQRAIAGREVVLLFDTFERVQQREAGQWLLRVFLPQVRSLIVVIAGRPVPVRAQMPDNVVSYGLEALGAEEVQEYIHNRRGMPEIPLGVVKTIQRRTGGAPLLINLILDLSDRERFLAELDGLPSGKQIQGNPDLERWLVRRFGPKDEMNMLIWAMAYLKRRFDVRMLKYVVQNSGWFPPADYDRIFRDLCQSLVLYVKEYPERQSHLLHDEIQRLVAKYVLEEAWAGMRESLHALIVDQYYPEIIQEAEAEEAETHQPKDQELAHQLRAEQLGYILDQDPQAGFNLYGNYRNEIENTHRYDFEELLWGEAREHLSWCADGGYRICSERGEWLRSHSLFQKAEELYRQIVVQFENHPIPTRQSLGFMLLRQGKLLEAERVFQESRSLVKDNDFSNIAMVENTLGQVARRAGKWDQAIKHYNQGLRAATRVGNKSHMASVYLNRGFLYALQGAYEHAKRQCEQAIELLGSLPENPGNTQRNIHAHMNLGSAYRYSGDYVRAAEQYRVSLELARESNNLEAICDLYQHAGINEHYWGRTFRRDLLGQTLHPELSSLALSLTQEALNNACEHQLRAWQALIDSLEMAREADWRDMIDDGLNRLAKVYREIYRIQDLLPRLGDGIDIPDALAELKSKGEAYQIPLEHEYAHKLLTSKRFGQLDWVKKSIRLFDLSAIVADEVNDIRRALDSSTELARMFVELGMKEQVPLVLRRIDRLQGYDYQEELFAAMNEITRGDLDFMEQKFDSALERYVTAYADVAEQTGYASFLLTDRLRDLEWRLRNLPSDETTLEWCDALESEWQNHLPPEKWPNMLGVTERIRAEIWTRRVECGDDSGHIEEIEL